MKMYITLSVLLISLLAVGAYAQTQGEQVKEQIRPEDPIREIGSDDNSQNPGNGTATRTFDGPKDASGTDGDKIGDQPKTGVKEQIKPEDPIRDIGSGGNGDDSGGKGTANRIFEGPNDPSDKILDGECDGDQTRNRGEGDGTGDGENHELGESHRRGGTFTDDGPHGPMDHGDKILDGAFAGEMMQHSWGPGESGSDLPFGPNVDHVGYGQGGPADGGDPTKTTKGAARAGRR